jgi:mannose-6-phosphate isomerase
VQAGDFFFIPAGTLHAIGGGVLLAEVQQSSDTTYRVYDYGRLPARELHVEQALSVTDTVPYAPLPGPTGAAQGIRPLADCPYFSVEKWSPGAAPLEGMADGFVSLLVLAGAGTLTACGEALPLRKGESVLLPAGSGAFSLAGALQVLVTTATAFT